MQCSNFCTCTIFLFNELFRHYFSAHLYEKIFCPTDISVLSNEAPGHKEAFAGFIENVSLELVVYLENIFA